jgi:hypothetical protein
VGWSEVSNFEMVEGFCHIPWYGDVHGVVIAFPCHVHNQVECSGSMYKLSMLVTLAGDGVDDGARGVQIDGNVGDFSCRICHVMMDDDMGFEWALFGMLCVVCWELLSSFASARAP